MSQLRGKSFQGSLWRPSVPTPAMEAAHLPDLIRWARWVHLLTFEIPADAFGWVRHRTATRDRHGRSLPFPREYEDPRNAQWRDLVRACAEPFWRRPPIESGRPVALVVDCADERPKAHRFADGSLRPDAPYWKTSKPDADNVLKGVMDSLSKFIWHDDAQVVVPIPITRWTRPNERRRVLVSVFDLSVCNES